MVITKLTAAAGLTNKYLVAAGNCCCCCCCNCNFEIDIFSIDDDCGCGGK